MGLVWTSFETLPLATEGSVILLVAISQGLLVAVGESVHSLMGENQWHFEANILGRLGGLRTPMMHV